MAIQDIFPKRKTKAFQAAAANSSDPRVVKLARLTPRENDVLQSLMTGNTIKQTAELLGIGYCTANTHITSIYKKLEVNSRAHLILQYGALVNN